MGRTLKRLGGKNKMAVLEWIFNNWDAIIAAYFAIVGAASAVVKLTPTLKDDHVLKNIIRFVGKFIALNRK